MNPFEKTYEVVKKIPEGIAFEPDGKVNLKKYGM